MIYRNIIFKFDNVINTIAMNIQPEILTIINHIPVDKVSKSVRL